MRLVVWVYDPNWQKIGYVPLVKSVSVTRVMDGAGSIAIEGLATDENSLEMLDNERRVSLHVEEPAGASFVMREIGRGIIRNVKIGATSSGYTLSLDGVDELDELRRIETLFNRTYEDARVEDICADLAGLAGWGVESEFSIRDLYSDARFDGVTVLKALRVLAEKQDFHMRLGATPGVVQIGQFGQVIDLQLINPETLPMEAYQNKNIAFIESLSINEDTEDVCNRLYVFGAGDGVDASLTLRHSTRTNPYEIKWRYGPDNRKLYYIEDEDSIVRYGLIEKTVKFNDIAPLANNVHSIRRASNVLYDAAKGYLRKHAYQLLSFSMAVKKCEKTVRPGDVVRVVYKGVVEKDGVPWSWKSFDADMWVIKVTESAGTEGKTVRLEVANIDRKRKSAAETIVSAMEQASVRALNPQPSFNLATYGPYRKEMDTSHSVTVPLVISDATYQLDLCRLRIKTTPFRATASGAASTTIPVVSSEGGGNHRHKMFEYSGTLAPTYTTHQFAAFDSDGVADTGFFKVDLPAEDAVAMYTGSATDHTHDVNIPAHSHDLVYGIYDDTLYPGLLKITVDGQVVVENLGSSTEALDVEFDITEIINGGTLRSTHQIVITCTEEGSQGVVEVEVELYSMILPIKLG